MMSNGQRPSAALPWRLLAQVAAQPRHDGRGRLHGSVSMLARRALAGAALVLAGAVAGLAAGQAMAQRSAHRAGACSALNMAAALGYLDAGQQRQVRHALATALNPDVELFSGNRTRMPEACRTAGDR
jgi:hypothetical protein